MTAEYLFRRGAWSWITSACNICFSLKADLQRPKVVRLMPEADNQMSQHVIKPGLASVVLSGKCSAIIRRLSKANSLRAGSNVRFA